MKKGWQRKRLGDVLEIQNGYAFDSKGFNPTKGMPLIRIRSLKRGTETETRFDGDYDRKYVVKAGDLLIGMDGEFGCYEWKGEPALLNQRVCRLQGFSGELVPRFLFYGVNDYLKAIEDVTGYATVKHLSSKQILAIEFPVPPLAEQQQIVGLLDEAFAGIATAKANAEKNLQNARALFDSHLQSIFSKKGDGWGEKKLEALYQIGSSKRVLKAQWKTEGVPFYRGREITRLAAEGFVDNDLFISEEHYEELSKQYGVPKADDIVITAIGTIGNTHIVRDSDRFYFKDASVLWMKRTSDVNSEFVRLWLKSALFYDQLDRGNGATVDTLTIQKLKNIRLLVPPQKDQQKIVITLNALAAETRRLEDIYRQKRVALEALKKSLLHQAFSGEL